MLALADPTELHMLRLEVMEEVVNFLLAVMLLAIFRDEPRTNLVLVRIIAIYILYSACQTCIEDLARGPYFDWPSA